jgi:hypothetical protein
MENGEKEKDLDRNFWAKELNSDQGFKSKIFKFKERLNSKQSLNIFKNQPRAQK